MGETIDPLARQFIGSLKRDFRIDRVILFGSRATDQYLLDSDYDMIIVSPDFEGIHFLERISLMDKYWLSDLALEAICYTPQEFDRKRSQISIVSEAVAHGIEIAA